MKITNIIGYALLLCVSFQPAVAQVNKQVEVTKEFIPSIESREKITLNPELVVDGAIEPDIDYSITPRSIDVDYLMSNYEAVKLRFWEYTPTTPLYVKVAGGAPFRTVGDLYYTLQGERGHITTYANYEGLYSDVEGFDSVDRSVDDTHIAVGAAFARRTKGSQERLMDGNITYNLDRWGRYATDEQLSPHPTYQRVGSELRWGDEFIDMKRTNFAFEATAQHFWNSSNYRDFNISIGGKASHRVATGAMQYGLQTMFNGSNTEYRNLNITAEAKYLLSIEGLELKFGAKMLFDNVKYGESNTRFLPIPDISINYHLVGDGIIAYLESDGEQFSNSYSSLSDVNPYILEGLCSSRNSVEYNNSVGVRGTAINRRFGYNLGFSYRAVVDNIYWLFVTEGDNNYFTTESSRLNELNLKFELSYTPTTNLRFVSDAVWRMSVDNGDQELGSGVATFEYRFGGRYQIKRFSIGADIEIIGDRKYSQMVDNSAIEMVTLPTTYNLSARLDYRVNRGFSLFCSLTNLLNDDIYRWLGYREYGVGFVAGVQMQF